MHHLLVWAVARATGGGGRLRSVCVLVWVPAAGAAAGAGRSSVSSTLGLVKRGGGRMTTTGDDRTPLLAAKRPLPRGTPTRGGWSLQMPKTHLLGDQTRPTTSSSTCLPEAAEALSRACHGLLQASWLHTTQLLWVLPATVPRVPQSPGNHNEASIASRPCPAPATKVTDSDHISPQIVCSTTQHQGLDRASA
ncbi:hypothetical protein NN561_008055 [Cricetulus griseus]